MREYLNRAPANGNFGAFLSCVSALVVTASLSACKIHRETEIADAACHSFVKEDITRSQIAML